MTTRLTEAEPGTVKLDDGSVMPVARLESIPRPIILVGDWHWEGNFDVNLASVRKRAEESDHLNSYLDVRARQFNWRHHLKADTDFETKQASKTTDRWSA